MHVKPCTGCPEFHCKHGNLGSLLNDFVDVLKQNDNTICKVKES